MEKKSLGRSLEDISSTFMTQEDVSNPGEKPPIFLSNPVREASCLACRNLMDQPMDLPKCKIFSFKNEEYGVPFMESIMPGYAKYCRYFKPVVAGKSDSEEKSFIKEFHGDEMRYNMEVEDTVNTHKKIAFQDDGNVQNNLKKILSEHLERGYTITRIDLEKEEEREEPTYRIKRREEVTIFKKEPLSF